MDRWNEIKEKIQDADMILVAVGDEFDGENLLGDNKAYADACEKLVNQECEWAIPALQHVFLKDCDKYKKAVLTLEKLLENKNYFILSTAMSSPFKNSAIKEENTVEICGSVYENDCIKKDDSLLGILSEAKKGKLEIETFAKALREEYPEDFAYNTLYSEKFTEEFHKDNWDRYLKWLQGTLNKKLVIIELGVGLRYLNVVRLRMEKVCEMNQKAYLIRVHKSFSQIPSQIAEKSISFSEDSIDFMEKWNEMC